MPPSTWMHDFATSTAPSKTTATATSAANAHCSSSPSGDTGDVPGSRGHRLGGLQHLGAQVLDRLEGADLLAELLAHLRVLDRRRQAPARDAGRLGGRQRDRRTPEQVGRQVRARRRRPTRRPPGPCRTAGSGRGPPTRTPRPRLVGRPTRRRRRRRAGRASPTARPRRRRTRPMPTTASAGTSGDDERGDRRPEQRPGHQLVGARLERHRHVEHRAATAAGDLGQRDGRDAHLLRGLPDRAKVASASVSAARASSRPSRSAAHLRRLAASSTCSSEIPIDMLLLRWLRSCAATARNLERVPDLNRTRAPFAHAPGGASPDRECPRSSRRADRARRPGGPRVTSRSPASFAVGRERRTRAATPSPTTGRRRRTPTATTAEPRGGRRTETGVPTVGRAVRLRLPAGRSRG